MVTSQDGQLICLADGIQCRIIMPSLITENADQLGDYEYGDFGDYYDYSIQSLETYGTITGVGISFNIVAMLLGAVAVPTIFYYLLAAKKGIPGRTYAQAVCCGGHCTWPLCLLCVCGGTLFAPLSWIATGLGVKRWIDRYEPSGETTPLLTTEAP